MRSAAPCGVPQGCTACQMLGSQRSSVQPAGHLEGRGMTLKEGKTIEPAATRTRHLPGRRCSRSKQP
eukprot:4311942-Pyramimonas_sp.AAC.1